MAIKINWQDLKKRFVGSQEIVRVYKAWVQVRPDSPFDDYFWFTNAGTINQMIFLRYTWWGSAPAQSDWPNLEYSFDKETWTDYTITGWSSYIEGPNIILTPWQKVYRRSKSTTPTTFATARLEYWTFESTSGSKFYAWWDLTSLICKTGGDTLSRYCFSNLFSGLRLLSIPKLTATTLGSHCYDYLFDNTNARLDTTQHWEFQYPFRLPYVWTISWESPIFVRMFKTDDATCPVISPQLNTTYYCTVPTY